MAIELLSDIEPKDGAFQHLIDARYIGGVVESVGANLGGKSGSLGLRPISFDCEIVGVTLVGIGASTVAIDLKKCAGGDLPATVSLVGTGTKPALSAARYARMTDFSDWDGVLLSAGDVLELEVTSGSAEGVIDIQYTRRS